MTQEFSCVLQLDTFKRLEIIHLFRVNDFTLTARHFLFSGQSSVGNFQRVGSHGTSGFARRVVGCLPFDRKIRLECEKHNGKRFTNLQQKCHIRYGLNPKKGRICVA